MTQDEIIRIAREAGFSVGLDDPIKPQMDAAIDKAMGEPPPPPPPPPPRVYRDGFGAAVLINGDEIDEWRKAKDLTDEEIADIGTNCGTSMWSLMFARAVISADREKNK